jgi:hypothetical protein
MVGAPGSAVNEGLLRAPADGPHARPGTVRVAVEVGIADLDGKERVRVSGIAG